MPNYFDKGTILRESVLGKPSYSGSDIRVYARLYDGGKYLNNAIAELKTLEQSLSAETTSTKNNPKLKFPLKNKSLNNLEATSKAIRNKRESLEKFQQLSSSALSLVELSEMQTISYSIHREKVPIRACGANYVRGYARGSRSIAGSMIFTVFNEHVLSKLMHAGSQKTDSDLFRVATTTLADQLPPIDIQIFFANEFGDTSYLVIYGVEFLNEGQTMSIEDLLLESIFQYVAQDIDPMRKLSDGRVVDARGELLDNSATKGTNLLYNNNVRSFLGRNNPFDFTVRPNIVSATGSDFDFA